MITTPPPATTPDLSPADEAWLRQFLVEARGRAPDTLSLEELHGFLFAIVAAPDLVLPSEWIPAIFDDDGPVFADEAAASLATQSRHAATTVVAMPAARRRRSGMDIGMGGILRSRAVLPSDVRHEPGISAGAGAGVEHQA